MALRGAGLAWIVMGLLTFLAAWNLSDFGTITDWWEFFWIKLTVPGRMLVLVFGLALICAGIFAWRCARWAAYVGLGLGYLWLVGAIVFLLPVFPLAVLSIALGHRALWLANPRRRRGDAATMGMGVGGSRRADWIAAAVTCLAIGPVAGVFLGVVFGYLVTAFKYIAQQKHSFYGLGEIYGAYVGGLSMGAGSMLGGLIGGATLGWKRGRTVTVAFLGGAVAGLSLSLAMFAQVAMEGSPASGREPWADVLFSFLLPGAAGGMGGGLGAEIARALSRAIRRVPEGACPVKNWKNRKLLIGVLLVYGLACALPAWWRYGEPVYGIACLLNPLALLTPFWWANPLFFAGCVALAKGRAFRAMALGIVATALATSFFPLYNTRDASASGIGSAFWVAAMACLAIAGFFAGRSEAGASARSGSTCGEVRASGPHDAHSTSDAGSSSPSKSSTPPSPRDDELAGSGPRGAALVGQ